MLKKFALLIGLQGSGKTHFAENYLVPNGYKFIDGDVFLPKNSKSIPYDKVKSISEEIIKNSNFIGIVFEFSNSDSASRKQLLKIGKDLKMKTEYFLLETSLKDTLARNLKRIGNKQIPEEIIIKRQKHLLKEPPSLSEGVGEIYKVYFDKGKYYTLVQQQKS